MHLANIYSGVQVAGVFIQTDVLNHHQINVKGRLY